MSARELITEHLDLWTGAVTQKRSGGRGNNGKIELTGIKKLRELILELAVRGKLVEQDPNDEPASVLLERIAQEKARLVKEGKIRKPRKLPPLSDTSKPFPLPEGWEWTQIEAIGHDWGQKEPDKGFSYIDVSAIDNIKGLINKPETLSPNNAPSRARKKVRPGTVIYSTVRPYLQNIAVVEELIDPEPIASTAFAIVSPLCGIPARFLLHYLRSPVFIRYVESVQTGIAYPAINDKQFFSGALTVPPLQEQLRIVEKVDELMALCDRLEQQVGDQLEAHEVLVDTLLDALTRSTGAAEVAENWARIAEHFDTLFTTEASIDKLKQAILQLAVMGRLVPQDSNDESASVLLEKIAQEKLESAQSKRKSTPLSPVNESEEVFNLPTGWCWARVGHLTNVKGGKRLPKGHTLTRTPTVHAYIRVTDMKNGGVRLDDIHYISDETYKLIKQYTVSKNDLYITIAGTIGAVGEIPEPLDGMNLTENAAKLVRIGNLIDKRFLKLALSSSYTQAQFLEKINQMAQPKLALHRIESTAIAIPPENEQHRIVEKVDELMAICDQLKSRLGKASETRVHLAEAVMEQAVQ